MEMGQAVGGAGSDHRARALQPLTRAFESLRSWRETRTPTFTIGPEAPRNLKPKPSNSMGPEVRSRKITRHNAANAAEGRPIVAAKCSRATRYMSGLYSIVIAPPP